MNGGRVVDRICQIFRAGTRKPQNLRVSEPQTHEFGPGRRCWGHDYAITRVHDKGQRIHASGWGCDGSLIQEGDYLLLEGASTSGKRTTRYQVHKIERVMNPPDMWHADLVFAPRTYATQAEMDATR